MKEVRYLKKQFNTDLINFLDWFDYDIKENQKRNPAFFILTGLINKIRMSQGLEENTEFMNDVHNSNNLSIEFINMYYLGPGKKTFPNILKMRTVPFRVGIDKVFDHTLETRKCILCIPLNNNTSLEYIDDLEHVDDTNLTRSFKIDTILEVGDWPFIMPVNTPFYFSNLKSTKPLYMLQIGFDCNPSIDEVYDQLSK
jgi:hypothetical protein